MKYHLLLTAFVFLFSHVCTAEDKVNVESILSAGKTIKGEAWYLGGPPESEKIARKMSIASKKNPAWIRKYVENLNLKPGEALPYHENLGISQSEYQLFVSLSGKLELKKLDDVSLKVNKIDSRYSILIEGNNLVINNFTIDLLNNTAITYYAELTKFQTINQDDASSPLGRWNGSQWKYEKYVDEEDVHIEKLAIGKSKDKNQAIIYYDIKKNQAGSSHFVITYDL